MQLAKSLVTMSQFSAIQKLMAGYAPSAMLSNEEEASLASITHKPHNLTESACKSTRALSKQSARALKKCIVPFCHSLARSRGLCKAHGGGKRCLYPDCGLSDQGGGYCIRHGGGRRCKVDGCIKSAQSRQFCKAHGGGSRCKYTDCNKLSQGGGFCRSHGSQTEKKNRSSSKKSRRDFIFDYNWNRSDNSSESENISTQNQIQISESQISVSNGFAYQAHAVEQCIVRGCVHPLEDRYFQPSYFCFDHTANLYWAISLLELHRVRKPHIAYGSHTVRSIGSEAAILWR
uniref:Uncharacterized protein AlNc14C4G665 n=1 Tax=Albugo laibachii Nc14 TaxID=890382 RepID=F0W0M5_9STRA|nr:conserved hypothetical protein [Albugo laibachii Nc14]|eukprot:CCA14597.1 conserved hypothetical protein [Albugo laibachii Nc14]